MSSVSRENQDLIKSYYGITSQKDTTQSTQNKKDDYDFSNIFSEAIQPQTDASQPIQGEVSHIKLDNPHTAKDKQFKFANISNEELDTRKFLENSISSGHKRSSTDIKIALAAENAILDTEVIEMQEAVLEKLSYANEHLQNFVLLSKDPSGQHVENRFDPHQDAHQFAKEFKANQRAVIDWDKGIAKFLHKPPTTFIDIKRIDGSVVRLKCVQMDDKERSDYEAKIAQYQALHDNVLALHKEILASKEKYEKNLELQQKLLREEELRPKTSKSEKRPKTQSVVVKTDEQISETKRDQRILRNIETLMMKRLKAAKEFFADEREKVSFDNHNRIQRQELNKQQRNEEIRREQTI
jgi:hypothetical protein